MSTKIRKRKNSEETKRKIAASNTEKVFSIERRKNIGKSRKIELSCEQIEKLKYFWSKHYFSTNWILKEMNIKEKVYRRYRKLYCEHEQIIFLPQNIEPKIFEEIIELCKKEIPYKVISKKLNLNCRQLRKIIIKLNKFYNINPIRKNIIHSQEHKLFLKKQLIKYNKQFPKKKENNPNWKGGISEISSLVRTCEKYQNWKWAVAKRDNNKCTFCGSRKKLEIDYIHPFCLLLEEGNIKTVEEAKEYEPLWDISNGRTLCTKCHKKTYTYGKNREKMKKNENDNLYIEQEISFKDLANIIGIDDLDTPEIYDISHKGYEILSFDHKQNKEVWSPLKSFVVKDNVEQHYKVGNLCGTNEHKIWVNGEYIPLKDYIGSEFVNEKMQVVDCEVDNTHNYIAEGQINHNTTTPGGMSIPYATSVRVKIQSTGQKQIQDKNGNAIGIHVKAKTIKNKVARPFRECEFQIHFGVGIKEHEEVFDAFRTYCSSLPKGQLGVPCGDKLVSVDGAGAWKTFTVIDAKTGEVLIEEKCHKPDFGDKVLYKPEYKEYIDALYSATYTMTAEDKEHPTYTGINMDSVEEITAAASQE